MALFAVVMKPKSMKRSWGFKLLCLIAGTAIGLGVAAATFALRHPILLPLVRWELALASCSAEKVCAWADIERSWISIDSAALDDKAALADLWLPYKAAIFAKLSSRLIHPADVISAANTACQIAGGIECAASVLDLQESHP
jgi:hypothetical protein